MIRDFSRCKRFGRGFVLAASFALLASSGARAATITHELRLEQWPMFDTSLGTLEEVRLDAYLRVTVSFEVGASAFVVGQKDELLSVTGAVQNFSLIVLPMGLTQTLEEAVLGCSGIGGCSVRGTSHSVGEHSLVINDPNLLYYWFISGEEERFSTRIDPYQSLLREDIFFAECVGFCWGQGGVSYSGSINLQYIFTPFEPTPETTVPEPTTLSLLALGTTIALLRNRRRKA